ncbi:MAG: DNA polymerase III subunit gamma/tau [Drouetiella hepatica Uher 2000/2452]|jgi:DNA polymerase-3 subunit gamma/tau|uniref:DNA polymerase III subunit gamma/tau n=1 Tax=Drouetiella hepatica Uher 2000/2452 TaxID=904376 RepID=A0A951UQF5_9CYAN|nr:DNA polymerase III subunit gamma/tau [Drouetiella hepatica Uher 2000/2452]
MAYEPLHHKYRPQTFAELVGQEAIASTLTNALRQQKIAPAYLFTGARGTGKTSSARILAKSLNCLNSAVPTEKPCGVCDVCRAIANGSALDVVEIDAASNTGVDNIRELIERSQFAPVQARFKVYVVDECHMLSTAAFNALLKTLEEPPDRVVFVLATTDPQKVLPTIISRCQRFDFRRIPLDAMVRHLNHIAAKEAIAITPEAIQLVGQISQGGLRDAESLLDQLSLLEGEVSSDRVWDLVGAVPEKDLLALAQAIAQDDSTAVIDQARHLMDRGREPLTVLQNLASFYRDLLIAKATPDRLDLVAITPPTWAELCQFVQELNIRSILWGQQRLRESEGQVKNTTQPRLWLEVTLMGLLPSALPQSGAPTASQLVPGQSNGVGKPPAPKATAAPDPLPPQNRKTADLPPQSASTNSGNGSVELSPLHEEPQLPPQPEPIVVPDPKPEISPALDLIQFWDQLVANLHPPGTQMLLRQQGHLIAFDGKQARVGFKSQQLFKMAIERVPNMEAAFEKICGHKVRVVPEVMIVGDGQPNGSQSSNGKPSNGRLGERSPQPTVRESSPEFNAAAPPTRPDRVERSDAKPSLIGKSVPSSMASASPLEAWQQEDEVNRAAKSVAQMFNGQIVDLEESLQPVAEAVLQAPAEVVEAEVDADDDDDVPF